MAVRECIKETSPYAVFLGSGVVVNPRGCNLYLPESAPERHTLYPFLSLLFFFFWGGGGGGGGLEVIFYHICGTEKQY